MSDVIRITSICEILSQWALDFDILIFSQILLIFNHTKVYTLCLGSGEVKPKESDFVWMSTFRDDHPIPMVYTHS